MPDIQVDSKTLAAVIKALKINAPIYSACRLPSGSVEVVTRHGKQTWKPAKRRVKKKK